MPSDTGLSGVRLWLSGSVPKEAEPDEAARLKDFTKKLALGALRAGARVVHGCHPSLTRPLLEAAAEHRTATSRKAALVLIASAAYRQDDGGYAEVSLEELRREAELQVVPAAADVDASLARMRDVLASQADALVAIGGRWWVDDPTHAGVPAEFKLAITRGIPSFLLGGLGGATRGYLESHPEILRNVRNGLDYERNQEVAGRTDLAQLVDDVLTQMSRLPLGRRETAQGQSFRILCLDGGGIRGVFTAAVLAKWEAMAKRAVAEHFDLIAGTSTGGILALGLGLGLSAQKIVDFYTKEGPVIFPMTSLAQRSWSGIKHLARNKFDANVLEKKLEAAYGQSKLGTRLKDSPQRLLICSYNFTSDELRLYRTSHHPSVTGHDDLLAVTVARATSAAPTYFKIAKVDDRAVPHEAVDGGVWANCPAMAALAEAVGVLRIPLDRIEMLSIGTTGTPDLVGAPGLVTGLLGWASRAPNLLMKAQMQATLDHVSRLLGERFLRVDDSAQTNGLDDVGSIPVLINKGADIAEKHFAQAVDRFMNGVVAAAWRDIPK
jgi:patatin-like phospholipase/acyl hydrolase